MSSSARSNARKSALLVAPITPAPTGNGLAMRAGITVQGLASTHNLTVAVLGVSSTDAIPSSTYWLSQYARHVEFVPLPERMDAARRWLSSPTGREALGALRALPERARLVCPDLICAAFSQHRFDLIWVCRLYMGAAVLPVLDSSTPVVVDVDEDDARTLDSIGKLHRLRGETEPAQRCAQESVAFRQLAAQWLPRFDLVVTASEAESRGIRERYGLTKVQTVPNVVPTYPLTFPRQLPPGPPTVLFVGNLDYFPNVDAVDRLTTKIWPLLLRRYPAAELHIVGGGCAPARFAGRTGVKFHGYVAELAAMYRAANAVVVPLRAGGGSRLKILEAFAAGVPVVASAMGAAGLDLKHEEQLLIADDDVSFAQHVATLLDDPGRADRLAERAARWVRAYHDAGIGMRQITAATRAVS